MKVTIDQQIFDKHPTFHRGLVLATKLKNHGTDERLETMLRRACRRAGEVPIDLAGDDRFVVWATAFETFGADANRFPPAHVALKKRVQRPGATFPFINKAVAVMNLASIGKVLPVGGDDVMATAKLGNHVRLHSATGEERFEPLGKPNVFERPETGEVVYGTNGIVMCRRWCWRNGHATRITEETTTLLMNTDGLGTDSQSRALEARDYVAELLEEFCGASTIKGLLSADCPEFEFAVDEGSSYGRRCEHRHAELSISLLRPGASQIDVRESSSCARAEV